MLAAECDGPGDRSYVVFPSWLIIFFFLSCALGKGEERQQDSPVLYPTVANMPLFDAADACNRVYQVTVSADHKISKSGLEKVLDALDAKRRSDGKPDGDDRFRLQLVWLVPNGLVEKFKQRRRPIEGTNRVPTTGDLRRRFDEYVVGVKFEALQPTLSATAERLVAGKAPATTAGHRSQQTTSE